MKLKNAYIVKTFIPDSILEDEPRYEVSSFENPEEALAKFNEVIPVFMEKFYEYDVENLGLGFYKVRHGETEILKELDLEAYYSKLYQKISVLYSEGTELGEKISSASKVLVSHSAPTNITRQMSSPTAFDEIVHFGLDSIHLGFDIETYPGDYDPGVIGSSEYERHFFSADDLE